jgi:hypothetical protein
MTEARGLRWRGDIDAPKGQWAALASHRSLQISQDSDGVWNLTCWRGFHSAVIGKFSDPTVAKASADVMPLDDTSIDAMVRGSWPVMAQGFAESRNDA